MPPITPNRSEDLTPAGERKRKQRGNGNITKGTTGPGMDFIPNPDWHPTAKLVWDSAFASGASGFYESTDLSILYVTCEGLSHWLEQGSRKSPELLRVLMANLNSLLFTESDRRKVQIELEKPDESNEAILASVDAIFEGIDLEEKAQ